MNGASVQERPPLADLKRARPVTSAKDDMSGPLFNGEKGLQGSVAADPRRDPCVLVASTRRPIMEDMKVTATGYDFRPAHAAMQRYVDGNPLSGFSSAVLVGRELVDVKCIGWADKEAQIPLRVDHIFRVFSNTKLITSCAALLLFAEGHFQLDDPIGLASPSTK